MIYGKKLPNEHPRLCGDGPRRRRRSYLDMVVTGGFKGPERERQTEESSFLRQVYKRRAYKRGYRSSNGVQNCILIVHEVCGLLQASV